jgi:hypothetical protein
MRLVFLSLLTVVLTQYAPAAPNIGMVRATPLTAVIGTPTQITVQVSISDPSLIANSINLLQLNADGTTTILGTLYDDGLNGDLFAGDLIFTTVVTLNKTSASRIQMQVSAAFKGVLLRVKSPVLSVFFQPANAPQQSLGALSQSLATGDRASALTLVNASNNASAIINTSNQQTLSFLASCLNRAVLVSSSADSRVFQCPFPRQDGTVVNMDFDMVPGPNGQWLINSW